MFAAQVVHGINFNFAAQIIAHNYDSAHVDIGNSFGKCDKPFFDVYMFTE